MRVLHIITSSRVSGAELLLLNIVRLHSASGIDSRIVCKPHDGFVDRARRQSVDVVAADVSGKLNPSSIQNLQSHIEEYKPDLVCAHLSTAALNGGIAARRCSVPSVAMVHGFTTKLWYRHINHLVCVSHAVAESLRSQGISRDRITVVHNGIDPEPYLNAAPADLPVSKGALCVGTIAHLSAKKGYADLVKAAQTLPDVPFFAAGEGPLRPMIESRARGRIKLLGFRDDVPALMNRFDVFCLPAHREPFGLVFLEAMAACKPVVAYRSGGAPEVIVHGETGFLAEPGNPESLARYIETLRADPGLRMKMGQAGRQRVLDHFTLERCATRLAEVFGEFAP